MVKSKFKWYN